ncbi:cupin domain-containing protein [Murinocardiopsis flavida]|nr:cupin domain-containing protein [Murinocardiopsis flavida]
MTTFASPTQGGSRTALWGVAMAPGKEGPLHAFDTEQVWTVTAGGAVVVLGGETFDIGPGDTVVMPADLPRQVFAAPEDGLTATVAAPAGGTAYNPGGITPDGACAQAPRDADRVIPPWTV